MENKNQNTDMITRFSCVVSSLVKKWRIIILCGCLFGILSDVINTLTYKPIYNARTVVAIVNNDGKGLSKEDAIKANTSISHLLNSQFMKNLVNQKLNQESFDGTIYSSLTPDTNFCTIYVQSSSQKNAYFELKQLIDEYQDAASRLSFGFNLSVVEEVSFSNTPLNYNNHISNYKKGLVLSVIVCIAIIGGMSYLKDNIKTASDVNDKLDARLFAKIPKEIKRYQKWGIFSKKKTAILVSHFKTSFSYVESMNRLASKLEDSALKHNYKTILITSSLENEGKSSVAVNLAISLAKNKHKVLVIDADFRKPSLYKILEKEVKTSFVDVLNRKVKWKDSVHYLEKEHIDVIFSLPYGASQELLGKKEFKKVLDEMKEVYDYIIVDSAPARYIVDSSLIAPIVDATLIVVKQNEASCKVINDTIYHLVNSPANIIGVIYNGSVYNPLKSQSMHNYRYGYYRYHREGRSLDGR